MKNKRTAIVMAGGIGCRAESEVPKQFVKVEGIPVIAYTLDIFQKSDWVDEIVIPCAKPFIDELYECCAKLKLDKVSRIVEGGSMWLESAKNALDSISSAATDNIIIFHESVRPLITESMISDSVKTCEMYGSGVSACETYEHITTTEDGIKTSGYLPRAKARRLLMPQSYKHSLVMDCFSKAGNKTNVYNCIDTMMLDLGYELFYSLGDQSNFKITLKSDVTMFTQIVKGARPS